MPTDEPIDFTMFLDDYLSDAQEGFHACNTALLTFEKDYSQISCLDEIFRVVHSLKSASSMLEFFDIARLCHACEDLLDSIRGNYRVVNRKTIDLLFVIIGTLETMVLSRVKCFSQDADYPEAEYRERTDELNRQIQVLQSEAETASGAPHPSSEELPPDHSRTMVELPSIEKISTVRINTDVVDALFDLVGELIIAKNRINHLLSDIREKKLRSAMGTLERLINALQEHVTSARMIPVDEIFQRFPRMVRNLARLHGKQIDFVMSGREIELDKAMLDAVSEPLIHLIRNAVDHGIESPEERAERGKGRYGTIGLTAERTENQILFHLEDDGYGINAERMKDLAVQKGFVMPEQVQGMKAEDAYDLLFLPGFSSAERVTDVSGRGVGLDVVKTVVERLSGSVKVQSQEGKGTRFTLELPLATAIMQTLMVGVGDHVFAIPSDAVVETLEVKPEQIREIQDRRMLILRREAIPFVLLHTLMNIPVREKVEDPIALIISIGDKILGLGVDAVIDQTENIIKPFDPVAQQFKGFSGGTILGDGRVALLLDIRTLLELK